MYSLLFSLFIVLTNETAGYSTSGEETSCEAHKQRIIHAFSTGFINDETKFDELLDPGKYEKIQRIPENQESLNEALGSMNNPFQKWAERIYNESKLFLQTGNEINPLYLPQLVPYKIKCMKLVPLCSGLMIPVFGYGNETASSAAVDSSFNKLKNITFKNILLPTDVELFLEHHISSLRGMSLLKFDNFLSKETSNDKNGKNNELNLIISPTHNNGKETSPTYLNSNSYVSNSPSHIGST